MDDINPNYMEYIFTSKVDAQLKSNDTLVNLHKTSNYGDKKLTALGLKKWNQLPQNIISEIYFSKFKEYIDTWFGPQCKCNICIVDYVCDKLYKNYGQNG